MISLPSRSGLRAYVNPWWTNLTRYDKEFLPHVKHIIFQVIQVVPEEHIHIHGISLLQYTNSRHTALYKLLEFAVQTSSVVCHWRHCFIATAALCADPTTYGSIVRWED